MNSSEVAHPPREEIELAVLLHAISRRKYAVIAATVLFALGAAILALVSKSVYRAEVVVTEAQDSGSASTLASRVSGLASMAGISVGAGNTDESTNAAAILSSRNLVAEFIERNNLVAVLLPDRNSKPSLWRAVQLFRDHVLAIHEDKLKGTTTITIDWSNPVVAARWANGFVQLANQLIRDRAISDSTRSIAYLDEQIAKTKVVELQTVMYDLIENQMRTLTLANGRVEYAFTTVDPAVPPEERIRPKRTIMTAIGAVCGFLLGLGIALFRERHSHS